MTTAAMGSSGKSISRRHPGESYDIIGLQKLVEDNYPNA